MAMNDTKTSGKSTRSAKVTLTKNADGTTTVQKGGEFAGKLPSTRAKKVPIATSTNKKSVGAKGTTTVARSYLDSFTIDAATELAKSSRSPEVLTLLANHPLITKSTAVEPSSSLPFDVRYYDPIFGEAGFKGSIARNPNTPEEILLRFVSEENVGKGILEALASNPKASQKLLCLIYNQRTPDDGLGHSLLEHANLPPDIIHSLLESYHGYTQAVVRLPLTSNKTLELIAQSRHEDYRILVPLHPNASDELLGSLSNDPSVAVRKSANGALRARILAKSLDNTKLLKASGWK